MLSVVKKSIVLAVILQVAILSILSFVPVDIKDTNSFGSLHKVKHSVNNPPQPLPHSYPSLICIGGTNAGSTQFIAALESEYTVFSAIVRETFYWNKCLPKELEFQSSNIAFTADDIQGSVNSCKDCDKMDWTWDLPLKDKCSMKEYLKLWRYQLAPTDSYWAEKTPNYCRFPHLATLFAKHLQGTKVMYLIRNPVKRSLSLRYHFDSRKGNVWSDEWLNWNTNPIHAFIHSKTAKYVDGSQTVIPQEEMDEDLNFVISFLYGQKDWVDGGVYTLCYYYTVLFWIKSYERYGRLEDLAIVQSSYLFENMFDVTKAVACWIETGQRDVTDVACNASQKIDAQDESDMPWRTLIHGIDEPKPGKFKEDIDPRAVRAAYHFFEGCNAKLDLLLQMYPQVKFGTLDFTEWSDPSDKS